MPENTSKGFARRPSRMGRRIRNSSDNHVAGALVLPAPSSVVNQAASVAGGSRSCSSRRVRRSARSSRVNVQSKGSAISL